MTAHTAGDAIDGQQEELDEANRTLKYHLLGPSLTKAGQDKVDQSKVSEVIYNASKGSKYFNREEFKDKLLTKRIALILDRKQQLDQQDLTRDIRNADRLMSELEMSRDLTQYVVHVDCDAFYAAVEELEQPDLKKVPFAVGGGVLTTCNYVARQFGCRSGMAGFVAKKLCPQLIMVKPRFDKYTAKAQEVREVLSEYDPRFESASIDEAYLNITEYCTEKHLSPGQTVEQMRREVHARARITVSAGIAANAKLAKICSNMNKPNGQYELANDRNVILAFMRDLPTRKVNGIGRVLERELLEIGVKTCGDIYDQRQYLARLFGEKAYVFLLQCHLGLGRTRTQPAEEYERKSVGTESTFHEMSDPGRLRGKLRWTAEELEKDLKRAKWKGRTLCLKVKLHTFEVYTRQVVTQRAIHLADELYEHALPMLAKLEQEMPGMRLRLMGLRCTHLVSTKRPDTMAFFGFRPRAASDSDDRAEETSVRKRKGPSATLAEDDDEEGVWEEWPPLDDDHDQLRTDQILDDRPSGDDADSSTNGVITSYRHHGKEITPNPKKANAAKEHEEELWDCPICSRPQAADERVFNEHIDLCLSRQTIRDAMQDESGSNAEGKAGQRSTTPDSKKSRIVERKRGRPASTTADPKQRKLFFG